MAPTTTIFTREVSDAVDLPGQGKARRCYKTPPGPIVGLLPGINTLHDVLQNGVSISGDKPFLGTRAMTSAGFGPYSWQTYNQVLQRVKNLGAGLVKRGMKEGDNIGLFSINRAEWIIAEHACFMYGSTTVPLYDTLGEEAIEYIIGLTHCSIVVATSDKAKILIKMAEKIRDIKTVVIMDEASESLISDGAAAGMQIFSMKDTESVGAESPLPAVAINKDTIATICFTSGTTGLPKGVVLSHENLLSFNTGARTFMKESLVPEITSSDVHISYLPLAHVFERIIQCAIIYSGASIGFYQGDTFKLLDDVAELKPTVFVSVPRLYNRIYDKVLASVKKSGGLSAKLFNHAYATKKKNLQNGVTTHVLWDALVFSKIRARLGGRVRWMLCGAAPISADVVDFMRICFLCSFSEGYGQTETSGGASCTVVQDTSAGHIGVPMPQCEIKLFDVPDLNYTSQDKPFPRGEICVRGACVFKGYYNSPEKTAEVLDADGWCHTGDIGMWDAQGRLKIIDRVKHIFKLAQGEYIAPEKIEMVYHQHELVAQSFVYGDSLQSTVIAVIVPDKDSFMPWTKSLGATSDSFEALCKEEMVKKAMLKELTAFGKSHDLKGFECVKAIHLDHTAFSPENNLLSPTFKLKRHEAKKLYQPQITAMYEEINKV
ncbi:hypothetical protein BATDEDRAFT_84918 [Batrachochytrium dendrobatidis JAM81]|uniref:Long-chain-fatty-acid--CoA ligase n=2 Tax=Batrachochytrium dendrobatidis TaxID=109871 RepID=F4NRT5_BATDJ|nr:uncharacterized protein BATDEDRAFT_84918 [Batrachochytrium dendrobatidis JAM81]EGF83371.1 hypothetical protein BATDEDRAFT_84918 [Batrachochytrium dendrobatidis JAM81]KAJ8326786.1 medium-chain fatty acid-CoA ligase faa2 [Batrachochytrium dendrobatidis]KAK5668410.1 medium-chain fatty acid-CoA ligase faa2 [Batrachochytrium dendrobatidis]OAJ36841.1 hypothetical protein BDEG_20964 [Batrachochytrium dendrobatidis JEL423]|eukprot:XP_006676080.1 hypothetical protein BATDEDRAFT_84918 [Batrachochytrium dendrobatidis JAM81]